MTSSTQIRGTFLRVGELPPAAGARREEFLRSRGAERMRLSLRLYSSAARTIGLDVIGVIDDLYLYPGQEPLLPTALESREINWRKRQADLYSQSLSIRVNQWIKRGFRVSPLLLQAEHDARQALNYAVDAYNYWEDFNEVEEIHRYVHEVGAFVRVYFGCIVAPDVADPDRYWIRCPVSMMHKRWGNSIGYSSVRLCSICGEDLDTCPHLIDREYRITIVRGPDGGCNACAGHEECPHIDGASVVTMPVSRPRELVAREVSMVPRPREPLARISELSRDRQAIAMALGTDPAGVPVTCDICLWACQGFQYLPAE